MRLGLLGPVHDRPDWLEGAARHLVRELAVDRVVYLGVDQALDRVVRAWAEQLVGGDPGDEALFARATASCSSASPEDIDRFLARERERRALSILESLPDDDTRLIELLDGKVTVMIHDKGRLDEEDILPASLLVFGKSKVPLVKQVGSRWFLSPGYGEEGGMMTIEDTEAGVDLTLYDHHHAVVRRERLGTSRGAKLKVSGSA